MAKKVSIVGEKVRYGTETFLDDRQTSPNTMYTFLLHSVFFLSIIWPFTVSNQC